MGTAARRLDRLYEPGLAERVLSHMVTAVQRGTAFDEPFSHAYFEDIFPVDVYARILAALPDPDLYLPLNLKQWSRPDGTSTRDRFLLTGENIARLDDERQRLWSTLCWVMSHEVLKRALFHKLAATLSRRTGVPKHRVEDIETHPRMLLFRDTDQYRIKPHPDGLETIATMGFYLAPDNSQLNLGTSIYRRRSVWGTLQSGQRFEEVRRIPFRPNSAYGFAVINDRQQKSWHGVELVPGGIGVRNTILNRFVGSADDAAY